MYLRGVSGSRRNVVTIFVQETLWFCYQTDSAFKHVVLIDNGETPFVRCLIDMLVTLKRLETKSQYTVLELKNYHFHS